MKTYFLSIGLSLFTSALFAQDLPQSQVPSVVVNQFNNDFPKAKDVDWELKNNVYNVEFEQGWDKDFEAWYSADGKQIKLEEDLTKRELPKAVIATIEKEYPSFKLDDIEKITEAQKVTYKVEIENKSMEKTLFINENGIIKQ
ncbi:putative PepSY-like beta-lactamase-inhibitor [Balneicella halophila]|uniref:Putative PepSY-like beta-lactamase-inhibitor n=1 Tax=Balneicella halophila TaxID=1537566 RepID=A0A7L4UN30_BALHA|nr:PepSY-like domain-containing protein [Balneicella halophila]PVX49298.1 putative PepSY-like beta-lactamase-inhibitor [Balneicella halophila]